VSRKDAGFFYAKITTIKKEIRVENTKRKWKSWKAIVLGFVAVTIGGFRNTAWSEDVAPPSAPLTLEERVNLLERKVEVSEENGTTTAKTAARPAADKDGFALKSADGNFLIKVRAVVQADGRFYSEKTGASAVDQFLLRRIRPIVEGTLWKEYDFRITPDLANNSATSLFDAYLDIKTFLVKLRVGKFKPPVGLERLQSATDILFVERGFPTALVPSRDTGMQLFGDIFDGKLSYAASFTNGVTDGGTGETDANDGKEGAIRLFAHPFKDGTSFLQGLGVGAAATYADSQVTLSSYRSPGQLTIFTSSSTATGNGEHIRVAPQAYWYWRSLGILGEYVRSSQRIRRSTFNRNIANEAWQVAASYVLTGEEASFKGVKPQKNFDPRNGGWGAFELAGRLQRLDLDPENFNNSLASRSASVSRAIAWSTGINWHLNRNVKFVVDYEQTKFKDGAGTSTNVRDRPTEKIVFTRWQISY
jgi:phosphate-selective porin OprO and OprP